MDNICTIIGKKFGQTKLKSFVFFIFDSIDKKRLKQLNLQSCIKCETIDSLNVKSLLKKNKIWPLGWNLLANGLKVCRFDQVPSQCWLWLWLGPVLTSMSLGSDLGHGLILYHLSFDLKHAIWICNQCWNIPNQLHIIHYEDTGWVTWWTTLIGLRI